MSSRAGAALHRPDRRDVPQPGDVLRARHATGRSAAGPADLSPPRHHRPPITATQVVIDRILYGGRNLPALFAEGDDDSTLIPSTCRSRCRRQARWSLLRPLPSCQRLQAAGNEEVLLQVPRSTVAMLDAIKERDGLRSHSQAFLHLIEQGKQPPADHLKTRKPAVPGGLCETRDGPVGCIWGY